MQKFIANKPVLIMLYGFPGAGKTHFARQLSEVLTAANVQGDRIRGELFSDPTYNKQENDIVEHLMHYMSAEFLNSGISVIYDTNAMRLAQRRELRDIARKMQAQNLLIWLQIDTESALTRLAGRDKRKSDDKYAATYNRDSFDEYIARMQNPSNEEFMVISGKHTFNTQKGAVIKKLYDMGVIDSTVANSRVIKPGLVNLVPNPSAGRVDLSRRNIIIR